MEPENMILNFLEVDFITIYLHHFTHCQEVGFTLENLTPFIVFLIQEIMKMMRNAQNGSKNLSKIYPQKFNISSGESK
jgi:hypothetical protein